MLFVMGFYPELDPELSRAVASIREVHDPTFPIVAPHFTVLFPTPERVGAGRLMDHLQNVLHEQKPFEIELGGLTRSPDHWLFLGLRRGEERFRSLYGAVYSGMLEEYRWDGFVPHLGLGLFLKPGVAQNWREPKDTDLDADRYEEALAKARTLPLSHASFPVETLRMSTLSESVAEWFAGKRSEFPRDARLTTLRQFRLGQEVGAAGA